jgi:hypothetical protein
MMLVPLRATVAPAGRCCSILAGRSMGFGVLRATLSRGSKPGRAARGQAGPTPLVLEVAASVTPCRHDTGPTVLDEYRQGCTPGSATVLGGDVVGTYEIAVALELAVRTRELAISGFGDALSAGRARGRGPALVHQPDDDAGSFSLVP